MKIKKSRKSVKINVSEEEMQNDSIRDLTTKLALGWLTPESNNLLQMKIENPIKRMNTGVVHGVESHVRNLQPLDNCYGVSDTQDDVLSGKVARLRGIKDIPEGNINEDINGNPLKTNPIIERGLGRSERIPNIESKKEIEGSSVVGRNTVDLGKLYKNVEKQKSKEYSKFRCPNCGQAKMLYIKEGKSVTYSENKKLMLLSEKFIEDITAGQLNFVPFIQGKEFKKYKGKATKLLLNENNSDTECTCLNCKKDAALIDWIEAEINPKKYFEFDIVCDVCGGEVMPVVKDGKVTNRKCEQCGQETTLKGVEIVHEDNETADETVKDEKKPNIKGVKANGGK